MREVLLPQEMVHTGDLILVNSQFPFRETGTDRFLLPASFGGSRILLDGRVARLLEKLVLDLGGGEALCPVSGWRSREEQEAIYTRSLQEHGRRFTEQYVALPGHSEHQTGLAVDLGLRSETIDFLRPDFPYEGICQKFREQAVFHGFILRYPQGKENVTGIAHEPWHFRYVGAPHAQLIEQNGLCLEEYASFLREMGPQQCRLAGGRAAQVLYVPCENGHARLPGGCVQVSGDNAGGFIATVWQAGARRCGA